jgi:rubrerythrin
MSTLDDLKVGFAGESQANRKYLAFAIKADAEGQPQVARIFRAAAEAETVHAHAHLKAMGGIKDTASNLAEAVAGEAYEFTTMYPEFIVRAEAEGAKAALASFKWAMEAEKVHHAFYSKALAALKAGQKLAEKPLFICTICGDVAEGQAPDKCPICHVGREKYREIK